MSLFGSNKQPAAATSAPTFGATTSSPAFGFGTSTNVAKKPLFGAPASTQAPLFGNLSNASTFAQSKGLFAPKTTALASTAPGYFSSASKPVGLSNAPITTQLTAQTSKAYTLQDIIQNSDNLIRSLTAPEVYSDDRDAVIAKLNQLLAACGISGGYFKSDQQPFDYNADNPFYRFKAIGYSRRTEYTDNDGVVALTLAASYDQLSTATQRQKFVDVFNLILGNNTDVRAHIELIRPMPDNQTEVLLYVTEKGKGRAASRELCTFLNQPTQNAQLKAQLCVCSVITRTSMDGARMRAFIQNPPAGFEAQLWKQAINENPDPEHLLPYPIRGFEELRKRQIMQLSEAQLEERVTDELKKRLNVVSNEMASGRNKLVYHRQRQKELSHRLLRCVATQLLLQQYSVSIDDSEEKLESRLDALNACLSAPNQIKARITNLLTILRGENETLRNADKATVLLTEMDITQTKRYLSRAQQALEAIVATVNSNKCDLDIISSHLS